MSLCPPYDLRPWIHSFIHSFIHSGHFYSAPSSPLLLRGAPDYSTNTVSEFHAEAHRQLQVKDLPKVPTWRIVEPTTLRLRVIASTNAPPCPFIFSTFVYLMSFRIYGQGLAHQDKK